MAPVRKGSALVKQLPRWVYRKFATFSDYETHPPILVNSLPKSGTHLLLQIARALPSTRYFGSFIAQAPSITMRLRSQAEINARIDRIVPSEVIGGHLHFTEETAEALKRKNVLHLFIYRDPRDVVISEAHYLAEMNRWHRLHKTFKRVRDKQERIKLAIEGTGLPSYPRVDKRFNAFLAWQSAKDCLILRYEHLLNPATLKRSIYQIVDAFIRHGGHVCDQQELAIKLINSISPKRSHTFHRGGIARWRQGMSKDNQLRMLEMFPSLHETDTCS